MRNLTYPSFPLPDSDASSLVELTIIWIPLASFSSMATVLDLLAEYCIGVVACSIRQPLDSGSTICKEKEGQLRGLLSASDYKD